MAKQTNVITKGLYKAAVKQLVKDADKQPATYACPLCSHTVLERKDLKAYIDNDHTEDEIKDKITELFI